MFKIQGEVREDGSATILARACARDGTGASVTDEGKALKIADVATITCKFFFEDETTADTSPAVVVATSIKDTLQTDSSWKQDAIGYNFAHDLPVATFSKPGKFLGEYKLTTTGGAVAWGICELSCNGVRTS